MVRILGTLFSSFSKISFLSIESPKIRAIPSIDNRTFFGLDNAVNPYLYTDCLSVFSTSSIFASTSYLSSLVIFGSFLLIDIELSSICAFNLSKFTKMFIKQCVCNILTHITALNISKCSMSTLGAEK